MSIDSFLSNASKRLAKNSIVKEIDTETEFCKYAKTLKCNALKLKFLNRRGFPDRAILCPGARIFFIEFKKSKTGKQSGPQKLTQRLLESYGFKYYLCDDLNKSKTLLDDFLDFLD